MYKILYGQDCIYDPMDDKDVVTDARISQSDIASAAYLDFTISKLHPLYDTIKERSKIVTVKTDDTELFEGFISEITEDIDGNKDVTVSSVITYLGDTLVRPYTCGVNNVPNTIAEYFQWLIDKHNSNELNTSEQFVVGVNQGNALSSKQLIYASATEPTTTASNITDNIINVYGGYLTLEFKDGMRVLNLYSDIHDKNDQVIDFGVNITDFTVTEDSSDQYTAVYPIGGTPDSTDQNQNPSPITIASLPDNPTDYSPDYIKHKDVVYSISGVQKYGYREYYYSVDYELDPSTLLNDAIVELTRLLSPKLTIEVKAVDLSLYMDNYSYLMIGQAVRVRSSVHDVDEFLMVSAIDIDLQNPENTVYTLGEAYNTLTGQQSSYLKSLTSGINSAIDTVSSTVSNVSANTIRSYINEYATSTDYINAPVDGYSQERPTVLLGYYLWLRVTTVMGDGSSITKDPVMISGNPAVVTKIDSSQGLVFKNTIINTVLTVSVFYGSSKITNISDLRSLFGSSVYLEWTVKAINSDTFVTISSMDPRLTDDGFTFTISPADVDVKSVFECSVIVPDA